MSRRRRTLRPEELDLWNKVAARTERFRPEDRPAAPEPRPLPKVPDPQPRPPEAPRPMAPFRLGQKSQTRHMGHDLAPPIHEQMAALPLRMDRKTHGKITKGKMTPEARIDLHGMTQEGAHTALLAFILRSVAEERRLVLVITGKGKRRDEGGPIPVRHGVLRHQVPHWLQLPPLTGHVLQITPAHQKHGGGGAYYVYLRRSR